MSKAEEPLAIEFRSFRGFIRVLRYFGTIFLFGWFCSYIATRFFNVDTFIINYHLANPWLTIPEATIFVGYIWLWNWSRTSEKKKRQKEATKQLKTLMEQVGGENKK